MVKGKENQMKEIGYVVQFNSCRSNDEDSFVPMTKINYVNADKGFNWWDKKVELGYIE